MTAASTSAPAAVPTATLVKWSAPCLALAGVMFATFLALSNGQFTGAAFGLSMRHHLAHTAHFVSAMAMLFAVLGLYAHQRALGGTLAVVMLVVGVIGSALFVATGVITAFVWRTISAHAPQLVEANGAFFEPPLPIIFIATVLFSLTATLIGATALRTRTLPRGPAWLLIAGSALVLLPPPPWGPVPYPIIDAGGVCFMLGCVGLARGMR